MSDIDFPGGPKDIDSLLSTRAIRDRAAKIFALVEQGQTHFRIRAEKLLPIAEFVAQVTRKNYPKLDIPFHSRWKHFLAGSDTRMSKLESALGSLSRDDRARAKLDLVVVSVLLDAGAGSAWKYRDPDSNQEIGRSEGLALASFDAFMRGTFSAQPGQPYRVDASALKRLDAKTLSEAFQVSDGNPLEGFAGRLELMHALGDALTKGAEFFGASGARPSGLLDYLRVKARDRNIGATEILTAIQKGLSPIWPGRVKIAGFNMGDVWVYPPLGEGLASLLPFHKLSQWLTYSMVEPLQQAGFTVTGFDDLTALAEYRNGGLLVDMGLLELRNASDLKSVHKPSSALVIEWRALTVHLMEPLANSVRTILGKNKHDLPLGKVLEGGTWWAGRQVAAKMRSDGSPPIRIESDGTVF